LLARQFLLQEKRIELEHADEGSMFEQGLHDRRRHVRERRKVAFAGDVRVGETLAGLAVQWRGERRRQRKCPDDRGYLVLRRSHVSHPLCCGPSSDAGVAVRRDAYTYANPIRPSCSMMPGARTG